MKFSHKDMKRRDIRGFNVVNTIKIGKYNLGVYNPNWSTYPEIDNYPRQKVMYLLPSIVFEYGNLSWEIKFFFLRFTFGIWGYNNSYF